MYPYQFISMFVDMNGGELRTVSWKFSLQIDMKRVNEIYDKQIAEKGNICCVQYIYLYIYTYLIEIATYLRLSISRIEKR